MVFDIGVYRLDGNHRLFSGVHMEVVVFFTVAGAVIAAFAYLKKKAVVQAAQMFKILEDISAGASNINFVLAHPPLVISDREKVVAVLPKTILLEPRAVRVRQGSRSGSSMRWTVGYSTRYGRYTSTTESEDQQRAVDIGTLVVTDQRVVFLGALKTVSIDVNKIMGADQYPNGIGLHCMNKEKVEAFRISHDLMLTYKETQENISLPFTGAVLERLVSRALAGSGNRKAAAAA